MPIVLYGCENWSLTLREDRRLRVFENRVLRRVSGSKRDEVTGEWRKLHNEELRDLYSLPKIVLVVKSRSMRWAGHVVRMGEGRYLHMFLEGKPEWKSPLGRPRRWWEDNIKMDLREMGGVKTGWSWLRIRTGGGHLWIRWWTFGFHKLTGISWLAAEPVSFSRRTIPHGVSKYVSKCVCQVRRWSRWRPRYLTSVVTGMCTLLSVRGGHMFLWVVKVTCTDLAWFTFIPHRVYHSARELRWVCKCRVADTGSSLTDNTATSSDCRVSCRRFVGCKN